MMLARLLSGLSMVPVGLLGAVWMAPPDELTLMVAGMMSFYMGWILPAVMWRKEDQ